MASDHDAREVARKWEGKQDDDAVWRYIRLEPGHSINILGAIAEHNALVDAHTALLARLEAAEREIEQQKSNIDRLHIIYGGAHAALTQAGISTMRGETIIEIDERIGLLRARAEAAVEALRQHEIYHFGIRSEGCRRCESFWDRGEREVHRPNCPAALAAAKGERG